jgi:two-component system, NtrC family, sensor histidine kinase HydH
MNRRLHKLLTSPALILGLILVIACTVSVVTLNSLQNRLFDSVSSKTASLHAAHEMEIALHMLRYHSLQRLMNPSADSRASKQTGSDHLAFEKALAEARALCPPEQTPLLVKIEQKYQRYRVELEDALRTLPSATKKDWLAWMEAHPLQQVADPLEELIDINEKMVHDAFAETQESTLTIQRFLVLLAVGGTIGCLCAGFATARRLSRSIARLKVRVQDAHSQLAPEVSVVDLQVDKGADGLHDQLEAVVDQVHTLVEKLQEHQREQARSQQLAVAGQLASSIAHEIRNPLTAMRWLVDNAVKSYGLEPVRLEDLQVLQGEIERMKQSVQGMLDFVRQPSAARHVGDIREIVHQAVELIRARRRQLGIRCELDLPGHPVRADFDHGQIKSVLVNLLLNALDAMPRGGTLSVHVGTAADGTILLEVADTGPGIPAHLLDKIFSPFVSTKDTGTGLGLTVSMRLVLEHGGRLRAENRAQGGARLVVELPGVEPTLEKEGVCQTHAC